MNKLSRGVSQAASPAILADRGAEAMRLGRFKEAMEIFKQLARQDPRPEWSHHLADANAGRARALADKGMFKEAAIVLENTLAPDGTVREPRLYLTCLIRQGQHQKAARTAAKYSGTGRATADAASVTEVAAALSLAAPAHSEASTSQAPGAAYWAELSGAAQAALDAWVQGQSPEAVDALLTRIPLRSPFGPLRLILRALLAPAEVAGKALVSCPRFLWTRYCREKREQRNGFDQGSECEGAG